MCTVRALAWAGLVAVACGAGSPAAAQGSGSPPAAAGSPLAPVSLLAAKSAPLYQRLDAGLCRALDARDPLAEAQRLGYRVREGRIQVYVVVEAGELDQVTAWLQDNGAAFVSSAYDIVQAHVRPRELPVLDTLPGVVAVRMPSYVLTDPQPVAPADPEKTLTGSYVTEGLAAMNATAWHQAGVSGQGVKVGVIDGEFGDFTSLLGTELPPSSSVSFQAFGASQITAGARHGTACAEIITDIAPGVELYLGLVETEVDIVNAAQAMRAQGVKVISASVGLLKWGGAGDGTGPIQSEVSAFAAAGGLWVNSAGNSRLAHYQGAWSDTDSDGFFNFSPSDEVTCLTADGVNPAPTSPLSLTQAYLVWNQWSSPQTDLDLYLYQLNPGTGELALLTSSRDLQNGQPGQLPVEAIEYFSLFGGYFCLAVHLYSGPPTIELEIQTRPDMMPLSWRVAQGSLLPPSDSAFAISVAALDAYAPYNLESYSSAGPTNGPGGSLAGGTTKPDISAFANVSTWSYGPGEFNGTSSACPHVAGAAALVWSAFPSYTNAQVRQLLESRAVDMGTAGKDNDYGYGRLYLGSPPGAGLAADFTWSPSSPAPGQTVAFTDLSTGSPTWWSWDFGDGGTSALQSPTHVFSAAGTYSVRLTVSNGAGSDQAAKALTVATSGTPPAASFTWAPASPTAGQVVAFTDTSAGSPTSWTWDFGDGVASTQRSPGHVFASAGTYTVRLTAGNAYGSDQESRSVEVTPAGSAPVASFSWAPSSPTAGQLVSFSDTSSGSPTLWAWDFGDEATSLEANPTHSFAAAGSYLVSLTVYNFHGNDQETRIVTVRPGGSGEPGEPVFIPAAAHAAGAGGTFFVTDLRLFNPGGSAVTADLFLSQAGAATRPQATVVVPPGEVAYLPDVVQSTFGLSPAVGAIEVRPTGGVAVWFDEVGPRVLGAWLRNDLFYFKVDPSKEPECPLVPRY